jgi:hypothetical protein
VVTAISHLLVTIVTRVWMVIDTIVL